MKIKKSKKKIVFCVVNVFGTIILIVCAVISAMADSRLAYENAQYWGLINEPNNAELACTSK